MKEKYFMFFSLFFLLATVNMVARGVTTDIINFDYPGGAKVATTAAKLTNPLDSRSLRETTTASLVWRTNLLPSRDVSKRIVINPFTMVVTPSPETCSGNGELAFDITGTEAGAEFEFLIYQLPNTTTPIKTIDNIVATGSTLQYTATALLSGDYKVVVNQVVDLESNSQTQDLVTIANTKSDLAYSLSQTPLCTGASIAVNVTAGNPATYELRNTSGAVVIPAQTSNVLTPVAAGNYTVVVTDVCNNSSSLGVTVVNDPAVYEITWVTSNFKSMLDCNTIKHIENVTYNTSGPIPAARFPINLEIKIQDPAGGPDTVINSVWNSNADRNQVISIPFYEGEKYNYTATYTDACGKGTTKTIQIDATSDFTFRDLTSSCGGKFLTLNTYEYFYGSMDVKFTTFPAGFDAANYNSNFAPGTNAHTFPIDANLSNEIQFGSATSSVPSGNYVVEITSCGRTVTHSLTVTNTTNYSLYASPRPGCGDNEGGVFIRIQRDSFFPGAKIDKLTSLKITAAPEAFVSNYGVLPFDASSNIVPPSSGGASVGEFNMRSLPAGNYTVEGVGECGVPISVRSFTVLDKNISSTVTPTFNCGSFNVAASAASNTVDENLWLQKYYPASGRWGHPTTGALATATGDITSTTGMRMNTSGSGNAVYATVSGALNNITSSGQFRVVLQYGTYTNAGETNAVSIKCKDVLDTFNIPATGLVLNNYYVESCTSGNAELVIDAAGVAPLNYRVVSFNGSPLSIDNGTNPVFSELVSGKYTVEIEDGCGNIAVFNFRTDVVKKPVIRPRNLCEGENGSLSVAGLSFLTINWTKGTDPTVLATGNTLKFTPFSEATHGGTYHATLSNPSNPSACLNQVLDYIIEVPQNPVPQAGTGQTIKVLQQDTEVMNLFDLLTGPYDNYGEWVDIANTGALNNEVLNATLLPVGVYNFEYSVKGPCSGLATTTVTIDIVATLASSISITKEGIYVDADANGVTNVGDTVSYSFLVTNTGETTLTNVTLVDNNAVVTGGPIASLAPGATDNATFTAVHTITQADIDAKVVYNLATVTGTAPDGTPVTGTSTDPTPCTTCPVNPTCPDCTIVEVPATPGISIKKEGVYVDADANGVTNVGDTISYSFLVTNTGETTLTNVTLVDNNAVVTGGPIASLAPGATDNATFTAVHTITQADIDAKVVYNLATVTGTAPDGTPVTGTSTDPTPCTTCPVDPTCPDCTIVEVPATPGISIKKEGVYVDADANGVTNVGDTVSYSFLVTNTGETTLTNISLTDNNAVVTGGPIASLAPGATDNATFTAVHTITQADIDAKVVYNLATVTGTAPDGTPVTGTSTDPTPCATCPVDPTCPDCTIVEVPATPGISIKKEGVYVDADANGVTNVGDTVSYSFLVTNTGETTLTNISLTDNNAVVTGGPIASLAPGATDNATFTAVHTITQADIDAKVVYNLATVTGTAPDGTPVTGTSTDPTPCATCPVDPTCPDCTIVEVPATPGISIKKEGVYVDADANGVTNVGDTISYSFLVTNTGETTLTNITLTDNNAVVTGGPIASLAPGATDNATFTAVHTITQADIDAKVVYNLATVTGTAPDGTPVTGTSTDPTPCATCPVDPTCPDCTIVEVPATPGISITKEGIYVDADANGVTNVGDTVSYSFLVTNTGETTLTNVTLVDNNAVVTGGPIASLAPGATDNTTFTAVHTITQADIDAKVVYNLATVTGTAPDGTPVTGTSTDPTPCATCPVNPICPDCTIVEVPKTPGISITKEGVYVDADANGVTNVGDTVSYSFVVTNTGETTLTNVTLVDNNAVVTGGPIASLALGATDSTTFTAVHTITQADIDAKVVYNLATVTGTAPDGTPVTGTSTDPTPCTTCPVNPICPDCTIVEVPKTPGISITKEGVYVDADANGVTNVGDTVSYSFVVTNTGETTLTNVTLVDNNAVVTGGPIASLALGATDSTTFTAVHTITQADIDAKVVYNLATVTGTAPDGTPVTGTSTDPTPCTTCPVNPICPDCTIVEVPKTPGISITKEGVYVDADANGVTNVGDTVSYSFVVTNTGETTLTNVTLVDNNAVVTGGPIASLALGATDSTTFTAVHTITQADIDAKVVYNLATVTGTAPDGTPVTGTSTDPTPCTTCPVNPTCPDCTIVEVPKTPGISITKEGVYVDADANGVTNVGDTVSYSFVVTNTGETTLTNVTLVDNNAVVTGGPIASLAPGATDNATFTAVHTITQADIDAKVVYNLATVTGTAPDGTPVTGTSTDPTPCTTCPVNPTCPDCTIVEVPKTPGISITKEGVYVDADANGVTNVGDTVSYSFVVTNTGETTLTNVTLVDNNAVVTGGPIASLAPGATDNATFTAVHTITQADIDAKVVYNLATVTGTAPDGTPVTGTSTDPTPCTTCPVNPICPDCTIVEVPKTPGISITKEGVYVDADANGVTNVGDTVSYSFVVTNTGETTLTNVTLVDNNAVVTGGPIASLAPGATDNATFTAVHTITQADIDAKVVYNLATVTGTAPDGTPVTGTSTDPTPCTTCPVNPICPDCTIVEVPKTPGISITKDGVYVDADANGVTNVGDTVSYSFVVTNTGETTLTNVTLTDNNAVVTGGPIASLALGATDSTTFTAVHALTQGDIDAGIVYNLATVTGTAPDGTPVTGTSTDPTPCTTCPVDPTCPDCTIVEVPATPIVQGCESLVIHNAISPNDDGMNESFVIENITDSCYLENTVEIYNRWGVKVFDAENYDNTNNVFRGYSDGRVTISRNEKLPTGTYFYILKYISDDNNVYSKSGYLYLSTGN